MSDLHGGRKGGGEMNLSHSETISRNVFLVEVDMMKLVQMGH